MNELTPIEKAILNGLVAMRQDQVEINFKNANKIQDQDQKKNAIASVRLEAKQLETISEKLNFIEPAIPNSFWGAKA